MLAVAAALLVAAGCGSGRPPPGTTTGAPIVPPPVGDDGDAPQLPGCGQQESGAFCDCVDAPLFADPPNMYFVLDKSGSMQDQDKWDTVRITVANVLRQVASRANFGVSLFPGGDGQICSNAAEETIPITPGDPPSKKDGKLTTLFLSATRDIRPSGATPTAGALAFAKSKLATAKGKSFVVLATDGGPNCDAAANCTAATCIPNIEGASGCTPSVNCCAPPVGIAENCLDADATVKAAEALAAVGIPVYVIGIPGSGPYADVLNRIADGGGTAQTGATKYFAVSNADQTTLLATLKQIAAKIVATCSFKLKAPPADENLVNVYFDEAVLPKDPGGGNGWSITGDTLTLEGGACQHVLAGDVIDVRIIVGCPSVLH